MINMMSPITTSIRTIIRKSVNMVAELDNDMALWTVGSIGQLLEDYSAVIAPSHRANVEPTPWWIGCSGPECRYWLEVPQLFECQDDLPESR